MQQQLIKAAAFHTQDPIMIKLDCFPILYERKVLKRNAGTNDTEVKKNPKFL